MTINLHVPPKVNQNLRPNLTVIGTGGAGGNAVNNMIRANLEGVNFVVANTDAQAIEGSMCDRRIQLGINITQGLGAGASPDVGRAAAEESEEEISSYLTGSNMVFITAGMGGGTGTGAAPVIARLAREQNILTVGVVTKPFHFEGAHRMQLAEQGLDELQNYVDTLIVIPNQNLFRLANERTTFADAFKMADDVLHSGVRGVTDLMVRPGLINLDFADIRTVMSEMGKAMMGTGEADGENRATDAAEAAISNPLLDDISMRGARGVLINITGGPDMTLFEVDEAANRIREEVDQEANIIFGSTFDDTMEGRMRVSVVATGIELNADNIANRPNAAPPSYFTSGAAKQPAGSGAQGQNNGESAVAAREAGAAGGRIQDDAQGRQGNSADTGPGRTPRHVLAAESGQQQPGRTRSAGNSGAAERQGYQSRPSQEGQATYGHSGKTARGGSTPDGGRNSDAGYLHPRPATVPPGNTYAQQGGQHDAAAGQAPGGYEDMRAAESARHQGTGGGLGFFRRMGRVLRSSNHPPTQQQQGFHHNPDMPPPAPPQDASGTAGYQEAQKQLHATSQRMEKGRSETEEDYFEIPAFLRRQANS